MQWWHGLYLALMTPLLMLIVAAIIDDCLANQRRHDERPTEQMMDYGRDDWAGGPPEFCNSELGIDLDGFPAPGRSLEALVEGRLLLEAGLATLNEGQREAVLLWADGWGFEAIGAQLGISKQGAHYRVKAGLNQMKAKLRAMQIGLDI